MSAPTPEPSNEPRDEMQSMLDRIRHLQQRGLDFLSTEYWRNINLPPVTPQPGPVLREIRLLLELEARLLHLGEKPNAKKQPT